jgi:hypothetical protein
MATVPDPLREQFKSRVDGHTASVKMKLITNVLATNFQIKMLLRKPGGEQVQLALAAVESTTAPAPKAPLAATADALFGLSPHVATLYAGIVLLTEGSPGQRGVRLQPTCKTAVENLKAIVDYRNKSEQVLRKNTSN